MSLPIGHYVAYRLPSDGDFIEEAEVRKAFFHGEEFFRLSTDDFVDSVTMESFEPGSVVFLQYMNLSAVLRLEIKACRYIYAPTNEPLSIRTCGAPTIGTYCAEHHERVKSRRAKDPNAESSRAAVLLAIKSLLAAGHTADEVFALLSKKNEE